MKRGSTIAVVAVSTGILAASAIAGVAVVSASNRSPEPATVAVIADPAAVIASAGALPAVSLPTADLPTVTVPTAAPRSAAPQPVATADDDDEAYTETEVVEEEYAGEDDGQAPSAKAEHDDDEKAQGDHHESEDHDEHEGDDD